MNKVLNAQNVHPQLCPLELVSAIEPVQRVISVPSLFEKLESDGFRVRWYTRDSPFERGKGWLGRLGRGLRHGRLLKWIEEGIADYDVTYVELSTLLDRVGHAYGPASPRIDDALARVERDIDHLARALRNADPDGLLIMLGDHGMTAIRDTVDVVETLAQRGYRWNADYLAILNGTCAQVRARDTETASEIASAWAETGRAVVDGAALRDAGYPAWLSDHERILAADSGELVLPNHFSGRVCYRGMHGYWRSDDADGKPGFILHGLGAGTLRDGLSLTDMHSLVYEAIVHGRVPEGFIRPPV